MRSKVVAALLVVAALPECSLCTVSSASRVHSTDTSYLARYATEGEGGDPGSPATSQSFGSGPPLASRLWKAAFLGVLLFLVATCHLYQKSNKETTLALEYRKEVLPSRSVRRARR